MRITLQIPDLRPLNPHGQVRLTASMGYFPNDALKLKHKHLQDKTVRREEMRTTEINGRTP